MDLQTKICLGILVVCLTIFIHELFIPLFVPKPIKLDYTAEVDYFNACKSLEDCLDKPTSFMGFSGNYRCNFRDEVWIGKDLLIASQYCNQFLRIKNSMENK